MRSLIQKANRFQRELEYIIFFVLRHYTRNLSPRFQKPVMPTQKGFVETLVKKPIHITTSVHFSIDTGFDQRQKQLELEKVKRKSNFYVLKTIFYQLLYRISQRCLY